MFLPIFIISIFKSARPFIKRNIFGEISSAEFIFLNSFFIGVVSFIYAYLYEKNNLSAVWRLSYTQYLTGFFLACMTVVSSIILFEMQRDSILSSAFMLKIVSAIALIVVGFLFYEEQISPKQLVGIFLAILATVLLIKR